MDEDGHHLLGEHVGANHQHNLVVVDVSRGFTIVDGVSLVALVQVLPRVLWDEGSVLIASGLNDIVERHEEGYVRAVSMDVHDHELTAELSVGQSSGSEFI